MRDIKFRGMTANGDFVYGDLAHDKPNETVYYKEYSQRICWYVGAAHHNQPVKNGTVGQYIGLKDKNGKEIYEGDILKFDFGDYPSPVEVHYFHSGFAISDNEGRTMLVDILNFISDGNCWHVEVIGNIYSNPELVEGVQ